MLCIAASVLPILAAFDVGPLHQRGINGPPWLAGAAGGIFVLAGVALFAGESARNHPLSYVLPILILMLAFLIGKSALEAFIEYRRTGKWPRNEKFIARMKKKRGD